MNLALKFLEYGLHALVLALIVRFLARRDAVPPGNPEVELVEMKHPAFFLWLIGGMGVSCAVLCSLAAREQPENLLIPGFSAVIMLASLAGVVEYFRARQWLVPAGFWYRGLVKKRDYYAWRGVKSVFYSPSMRWFVVDMHDGRRARIHLFLSNTPAFASALLGKAPAQMDSNTFAVLAATAQGNPPPMYG